jgi:hypothetical protein
MPKCLFRMTASISSTSTGISMISPSSEKKLLQVIVALACTVPLTAGFSGVIRGVALLGDGNAVLDSHFRYLSGLLFGIGVCFLSTIPAIERHRVRFRLLTILVVIGGIGRVFGVLQAGSLGAAMYAAAGMELVVTPLLCLWQNRLAKRFML